MPILVLRNNTGGDQNISIRSSVPTQPLYLKSIAWFYDPNGATREIDIKNNTTPTITTNIIRELNIKIQFFDNIDINSDEKLKGLIPVAINNEDKGIQYYEAGYIPSVDIPRNISFSIYDKDGNRVTLNGKLYFTMVFQYNRNEVFA